MRTPSGLSMSFFTAPAEFSVIEPPLVIPRRYVTGPLESSETGPLIMLRYEVSPTGPDTTGSLVSPRVGPRPLETGRPSPRGREISDTGPLSCPTGWALAVLATRNRPPNKVESIGRGESTCTCIRGLVRSTLQLLR